MTPILVQLRRPYEFTSPFDGAVFAALLLVVDPGVTSEERALVAKQLVEQGCRYAVCAGSDCSSWEDEIDWVDVMADVNGTPNHGFVMTTCHTDQPLEEVVEFFDKWALIDNEPPAHRVAIVVGEDPARRTELLQRLEAQ